MRGFVSYLFLVFVSALLVGQYALQANTTTLNPETAVAQDEVPALAFERSQWENGMDRVIAEKLREGMNLHDSSEGIKQHINQALYAYIQTQISATKKPIHVQAGMATMQTTNYLSLVEAPLQMLSVQAMNTNSHVFVLPLNQTQTYAEYTYTGGTFGTHLLLIKIIGLRGKTIAVLPSGYRSCAWNTIGEIPCAGA